MKTKIKKIKVTQTIERESCSIECPECKQIIKGNSEGMVIYNFGSHFKQKHPDKKFEEVLFK